jgi:hypothetical protein
MESFLGYKKKNDYLYAMRLINSNTYNDLAKLFLDVAKYVLTGAIIAPFFKDFSNSTMMYITAAILVLFVL